MKDPGPRDPGKELIRSCFLGSLTYGDAKGLDLALLPLLAAPAPDEIRNQAAVALGLDGVDAPAESKLVDLLPNGGARIHATLALLLGSTPSQAAAAVDAISDPAELEELKVHYSQAFGRFTDRHRERGAIARWVANAEACSAEWPRQIVSRSLRNLDYENGPGTMTRSVLRARLLADARSTDERKKADAVLVLQAMNARGTLASLGAPLGAPKPGR